MTTEDARRGAWSLARDVCFLNHGSFGATPIAVLEAQSALRMDLERDPVDFMVRRLEGLADAARERLGAFLGADPEGLAFVPNATTGVNTVLAGAELSPGDELLLTDHGYNACRTAAERCAARTGARLVTARLPFPVEDGGQLVQVVLGAVTPRTKLALLDHVTSPTGLVLPLEEIVPALRARGVAVLIDGAHAPGMLPLRLDDLGADWYTGNAHKWLCAPKGAAFLWAAPHRRAELHPLVTSHGANATRADRSRFRLEFDWTGTHDPTPYLCLPAALDVMGGLFEGGWDELRAHNHELVLAGRALLCEALGLDAPAPPELLGSLASVPLPWPAGAGAPSLPGHDPLSDALWERHRIEVPVSDWPSPPRRLLRISAQAYNALEQYEILAAALPDLLAAEQRQGAGAPGGGTA